MRPVIAALIVSCLLVGAKPAAAQVDTVRSIGDTVGEFHMTKSPTTALLLSAALPGLGQIYVGQAWKVPIIVGLAGGFLYGAIAQNHRYLYTIDSINNQNARHNLNDSNLARSYAHVRDFYRDDRDKWYIYLGLTYIATMLDAYISAHLYDFDVSDPSTPATSKFEPFYDPMERRWQLSYQLRF